MFIINTFSTCFGHHYAHLLETKTCVTAIGVLRWFCWMWLVAVVGRCVVGCEHCEGGTVTCTVLAPYKSRTVTFTVLAPYNAAPHNRYQPHPAEPTQHTACSNTRLVLLKMGIMMPETCWDSVDNKHLTVAYCWFSLSLHKCQFVNFIYFLFVSRDSLAYHIEHNRLYFSRWGWGEEWKKWRWKDIQLYGGKLIHQSPFIDKLLCTALCWSTRILVSAPPLGSLKMV